MSYELRVAQFQGPLEKLLELIEAQELDITSISLAQVTDDFLSYIKVIAQVADSPSQLLSEKSLEDKGESKASDHVRVPSSVASYRDLRAKTSKPDEGIASAIARRDEKFAAEEIGMYAGYGVPEHDLMRLLADFVAVASRLILLKSKTLLPMLPTTDEEEASMLDLELRLKLFKRLRPAMQSLGLGWGTPHEAFARPYLAHISDSGSFFYPGDVDVWALSGAIGKLFTVLQEFTRREETVEGTMLSLEEKMQEMIRRIGSLKQMSFSDIREAASRAEIIVTFLAILHLARDRAVSLEQKDNFSDIIIRMPRTTKSDFSENEDEASSDDMTPT